MSLPEQPVDPSKLGQLARALRENRRKPMSRDEFIARANDATPDPVRRYADEKPLTPIQKCEYVLSSKPDAQSARFAKDAMRRIESGA